MKTMKKFFFLIKYSLLSLSLIIVFVFANAQTVVEDVNFDNYTSPSNNDLKNHFYGTFGISLTQIQTNGITGGCLATSNSPNYGIDNAIYCSKYKGNIGSTYISSISFKYDASIVNPNTDDIAAEIDLNPTSNWNYYIFTRVINHTQFGSYLEILTGTWNNSPGPHLTLQQNHWYKLSISTTFSGGTFSDKIDLIAEVFDLGLSGTNNPTLLNSASGTIYMYILIADTAISIGITGARWGGGIYLDDFHYQGIKSSFSCASGQGINEIEKKVHLNCYPNPFTTQTILQTDGLLNNASIIVYNCFGQIVKQIKNISGQTIILNRDDLPSGIYYIRLSQKDKIIATEKLIIR